MSRSRDNRNEPMPATAEDSRECITLIRCPLCLGHALVTPDMAAAFEHMTAKATEGA